MVDTVPNDFYPALDIVDTEGFESASDGRIEFEGLPNTRDLGGIPAAGGLFVRHARLLRSGALDRATQRDLETLADEFDVRTVVDLRTEEERREHPDPEDALLGVRFFCAPVLSAATFGVTHEGGIRSALKALRAVQKNPAGMMMDVYARMVLDEQSQRGFSQFFQDVLTADQGAVLWHCTIGKDRAGLATMLMLHVLGVPRDVIVKDYEATNRCVEARSQDIMDALAAYGLAGKLDASLKVLNSADPRFLQAAFDAVDREYGSLDEYVRVALGVADDQRDVLRHRYLTDSPQG